MKITDILQEREFSASYEFFPPKDQKASEKLFETISQLVPLKPAYISVTYGAGGSARDLTKELVLRIQKETKLTVVAHLTCVGSSKKEIRQTLEDYVESGIENVMALRGDPPQGTHEFEAHPDGFQNAADLVSFIRKHFPNLGIGVAGFPEGHAETPNRLKEMDYFKAKVDSGADYICTQFFFDNRDFYDFRERCEISGIKIPIIAGIMPVLSKKGTERMSELALGARFPARLLRSLSRAENDKLAANVGTHWATEQVRDLLDNGVKGVHFFTLNKSKATLKIYESLGVSSLHSL